MSKKVLVLHGPNLNLLGLREPALYGAITLDDINVALVKQAAVANITLISKQSNSEAKLINLIHNAIVDHLDYIIINPAAFTHTSIALRDALLAGNIPFIEVHLSNIYKREPFRQHSYFSDLAAGIISGLGARVYFLALQVVINILNENESQN